MARIVAWLRLDYEDCDMGEAVKYSRDPIGWSGAADGIESGAWKDIKPTCSASKP